MGSGFTTEDTEDTEDNMDPKILELLRKAVDVCRRTRADGGLDRLEALAKEIEAAAPELAPAAAPAPAEVLASMDAAELSLAVARLRSTPEGAARLAELLAAQG